MPTPRLCSVSGCGKRACARGFCMAHYRRWQRYGDPLKGGGPGSRKFAQTICSVSDCTEPAHSRGWCRAHYLKWWRYSDPQASVKPNQNKAMPWLIANCDYQGPDCLEWPFNRNKNTGHGKVKFRGKHMSASRAMCILAHGEPPTSKHQAAHDCGKAHEGCVNPQHLRWALPYQNSEDRVRHGTAKQLTEADKERIRVLAVDTSQATIAQQFGVSPSQISRALSGARAPKHK